MQFKIYIETNEVYYKEAYSEMVSTLKFKKYEPFFAIALILFGILAYFYDKYQMLSYLSYYFVGMGVYELYKIQNDKRKWLNDRLDSKVNNQIIELEFNEDGFSHKGPFSNGNMVWSGLKNITKTQNGVLLKPENGVSIYLPNYLLTTNHIDFIMSKSKKVKS